MKNASAIGLVLLLGGCSLINSLDAVKGQAVEAGAGGGTASGGAKGTGGNGGAGTGGESVDASSGGGTKGTGGETASGGGGVQGTGGTKGTGGVPLDANVDAFVAGGPGGVIVTYQYDPVAKTSVVWVMDPKDGSEISLENSPALLGIAQDPTNDLWYFFQQPAVPTDPAQLQVRSLDVVNGKWKNIGVPIPVPVPASSIGVLNRRVAYLSKPSLNDVDQTTYSLTVLNTNTPTTVKVATSQLALPGGTKLALTANPGAGSAVGGTVTILLIATTCSPLCDVSLLRATVSASDVQLDAAAVTVGQVNVASGQPGLAYDSSTQADVLISPPTDITGQPADCAQNPTSTGDVQKFSTTAAHSAVTSAQSFTIGSLRISGSAFDACSDVAFATSLDDDTAVWAIPATSGTAKKVCQTAPGAGLIFEPYTRGLFRISTKGDLQAFDVISTDPTNPDVRPRSGFSPPANYSPASGVIAVRLSSSVLANRPKCP